MEIRTICKERFLALAQSWSSREPGACNFVRVHGTHASVGGGPYGHVRACHLHTHARAHMPHGASRGYTCNRQKNKQLS